MATASLVDVSLAVEAEFDRIKRARPHLASRINRAGHILTVHLSCPPQRMIKVRVRDGQARFLVNGSEGTVYVVDPADWSCSCPDAMQRGKGCKHGIACYVLSKADTKPATATRDDSESLRGIVADPEKLAAVADRLAARLGV